MLTNRWAGGAESLVRRPDGHGAVASASSSLKILGCQVSVSKPHGCLFEARCAYCCFLFEEQILKLRFQYVVLMWLYSVMLYCRIAHFNSALRFHPAGWSNK